MCWTPPYTRQRQTKQKHNTICIGHHHTQDRDKQNKTTTQYVLDTTMRKQTQIT
jgi:hypothetical protein